MPSPRAVLAEAPIAASPDRAYRTQNLEFTLEVETRVEPRITAADAPLWLLGVEFIAVP